jgi:Asp-tRNA(Asn)/Glu-tRNA(Gln) amidotransferase B subunit
MSETREARLAKFLLNVLSGVLNRRGYTWNNNPITTEFTAETFELYDTDKISKQAAIKVFDIKLDQIETSNKILQKLAVLLDKKDRSPEDIAEFENWVETNYA